MTATLRISVDAAEVRRGLGEVSTAIRRVNESIAASSRRTTQVVTRSIEEQRAAAARLAAHRAQQARQAETVEGTAARLIAQHYRDASQATTEAARRSARERARAVEEELQSWRRTQAQRVAAFRDAQGRMRAGGSSPRAEAAEERREGGRFRSAVAGGVRAGIGLVQRIGDSGDQERERLQVRREMEFRAMQIAAGDIGDARAAPEILAATRRTAETIGTDPTEVLEAIGAAQSDFSALGNAADRATYLNDVLPQLARAALASGTSLEDMVRSAGEFQRQLGVSARDMPRAVAMAMSQGHDGSVAFKSTARHMGAIGGGAARFLSSRPEDAVQSLAAANALFQVGGRGGQGGDVAATRTRGFLTNFNSARGQRSLTRLLGYSATDQTGQIRTREGETQTDALIRIVEEAYQRSRGSAVRFNAGLGGANSRSQELSNQFFLELQRNGGRLTQTRALINDNLRATPGNIIDPAVRALEGTELVQRRREDNRAMYAQFERARPEGTTDDIYRSFRQNNPTLARLVSMIPGGESAARGTLDAYGHMFGGYFNGPARIDTGDDKNRPKTLRDQLANMAQGQAAYQYESEANPLQRLMGDGARASWIDQRASELRQQFEQRHSRRGENLDAPLQLAPGSTVELGPNTLAAMNRANPTQQEQARSLAAGSGGRSGE